MSPGLSILFLPFILSQGVKASALSYSVFSSPSAERTGKPFSQDVSECQGLGRRGPGTKSYFPSQTCLSSRDIGLWRLFLEAVAAGVTREPAWFPVCSLLEAVLCLRSPSLSLLVLLGTVLFLTPTSFSCMSSTREISTRSDEFHPRLVCANSKM